MKGDAICYAVIYIIEAIIAWLYFSYLYEQKRRLAAAAGLYAAGYLLLFLIFELFDIIVINTFSFFAVNVVLAAVCFVCNFWPAVMHSALLAFIMSMAEILSAFVLNWFTGSSFDAYKSNFVVLITMAVVSKLLYYLLAMLTALLFKPHKNREKDPVTVLLLSALPLATMLVADAVIYMGMTVPLQPLTSGLMVASVLGLLGVDLLVLVVYNNIQKMSRENTRLQLAVQKDTAEAHMYQTLQTQYDAQRELIHDVNHHQTALLGMLREGQYEQATAYLEKLGAQPAVTQRTHFCQNPILNIILQQYHDQCKAAGVQLYFQGTSGCIDHLDAVSLTAVFSNLLSNAQRAAAASNQKYVELTVGSAPTGDAVITMRNSCDTPPRLDKTGFFSTTKTDAAQHGLGLASVRRVVRQYDGAIEMMYDENTRCVTTGIYLPPPDDQNI